MRSRRLITKRTPAVQRRRQTCTRRRRRYSAGGVDGTRRQTIYGWLKSTLFNDLTSLVDRILRLLASKSFCSVQGNFRTATRKMTVAKCFQIGLIRRYTKGSVYYVVGITFKLAALQAEKLRCTTPALHSDATVAKSSRHRSLRFAWQRH